jgi:hypothetical protein
MTRLLTSGLVLLVLASTLSACGGGDSAATTPVAEDPTVTALSGLLPSAAASSATDTVPATHLPPDATAALDSSLLPPS